MGCEWHQEEQYGDMVQAGDRLAEMLRATLTDHEGYSAWLENEVDNAIAAWNAAKAVRE